MELNGVNADGNANPTDATPGLSVTAGRRIVSNAEIAVNKGDIELNGGNIQATDGVYLGNSVYSRGWDSVGADKIRGTADDQKIGYGIRINGRVLGLFNMSALGLRTFSGITVGLMGTFVGVHYSLAGSALVLLGLTAWLLMRTPAMAENRKAH